MEKSDKLTNPNYNLSEKLDEYYTDIYSPGETKEQLRLGREVRGSFGGGKFAIGVGQRTAAQGTGTQSFTGLGFTPKLIEIQACIAGSSGAFSTGHATNTGDEYVIYGFNNPTSIYFTPQADRIIRCDTSTLSSRAELSSIDTDGFTLNWLQIQSTVDFIYRCFG